MILILVILEEQLKSIIDRQKKRKVKPGFVIPQQQQHHHHQQQQTQSQPSTLPSPLQTQIQLTQQQQSQQQQQQQQKQQLHQSQQLILSQQQALQIQQQPPLPSPPLSQSTVPQQGLHQQQQLPHQQLAPSPQQQQHSSYKKLLNYPAFAPGALQSGQGPVVTNTSIHRLLNHNNTISVPISQALPNTSPINPLSFVPNTSYLPHGHPHTLRGTVSNSVNMSMAPLTVLPPHSVNVNMSASIRELPQSTMQNPMQMRFPSLLQAPYQIIPPQHQFPHANVFSHNMPLATKAATTTSLPPQTYLLKNGSRSMQHQNNGKHCTSRNSIMSKSNKNKW